MTIIVFLIDTSASMNQRAYLGGRPTLLDVAKGAVETFVKVRQRSPESRGDRYMLMTFEDPPSNIKAGWKENLATFMNELKNLQCFGMTTMGAALKHTFDLLNMNRMQTGIDTYGQGRCPFYLEPSVIVVITDGGKLSNASGVQEDFNLPMHAPIPGSEMTREPFRWDQRLFSLVLRLSGTPAVDRDSGLGLVPSDSSPIDAMCEVTGGRSYSITSHRMLMQCIDSLVQKVQSGVVINFEKRGPDPPPITTDGKDNQDYGVDSESEMDCRDWDKEIINPSNQNEMPMKLFSNQNGARPNSNGTSTPVGSGPTLNNTAWHSCRRLIYVPRSAQKGFAVGFWPIPESFWPDLTASSLPPRSAHPNVKFTCTSQEPMVIENLPFDKYELEPSPLTQFILARKQPTVCWQVFVPNSFKNSEVGHPFGYLKASTNLTCVNLFVMPYNYPVLLPLLDELFKVHRQKFTQEWRTQFSNYLRTMPAYYAAPLRRALQRMGLSMALAQQLIPENHDNCLNYSVLNYLKRLKNQAKMEYDRVCSEVGSKQITVNKSNSSSSSANEGVRVMNRNPLKKELVSHPLLQDKFTALRDQLNEFNGFIVGVVRNRNQQYRPGGQSFRNPFDIPRRNLLDQVLRMRANFLQPALSHTKLVDDDNLHSMPVSQMGNYQEYLKKMQPSLREVESTPVRQHMFGNPFKIDKRMMVDEADIDLVGGSSPHRTGTKRNAGDAISSPRPTSKRKPGPIPKDVLVRRPCPSPSPPPSPASPPPPASPPTPPPPPALVPAVVDSQLDGSPASVSAPTIPDSPRSPSPPLSRGDMPPPVLQPYDGLPAAAPAAEVLSPPPLTPITSQQPPPPPTIPTLTPIYDEPVQWNNVSNHLEESSAAPQSNHVSLSAIINNISTVNDISRRELIDIRNHNLSLKKLAYKEVRRPGKNYAPLLKHLENIKGNTEDRVSFLKDIINECLRFKRTKMANKVEEVLQNVMSTQMFRTANNGTT
ncbi:integrator complex subunit 6 [Nilaparvata lugens]|uniref:integrator complex subunit 6 n=1 Tax=Nilaparvata lugens TaxID=108931 RepID=UPI00193E8458|nr:integrator complex subunit 6 [Nilaparvata lugens]